MLDTISLAPASDHVPVATSSRTISSVPAPRQKLRTQLAPFVAAGKASCARCGEPIHPENQWHLDHNDTRTGYAGVSHAYCNLRDGANKTNGKRPPPPLEKPYMWSQRWYDDPPVGTINYDGGRNPEVYLGNGNWQPLD